MGVRRRRTVSGQGPGGHAWRPSVQFVARYPRLYHMAECGSWPSIKRHGLLSTSALLQLFGVGGAERLRLESRWRPESVTIDHPEHGVAVIRDQRPMPPKTLELVLGRNDPERVVPTPQRQDVLLGVRERSQEVPERLAACKSRPHDVLTVDTREKLRRHRDRITLAPFNTGSTLRPQARPWSRDLSAHQGLLAGRTALRRGGTGRRASCSSADLTLAVERRSGSGPPVALPV